METSNVTISVVIPTRNRKTSLLRTLDSLSKQTYTITEVIVIDASDVAIEPREFQSLNLIVVHTSPSVCAQRNTGIKQATGNYIFLLDDDILLSENYIERLVFFFKQNSSAIAASGVVMEKNPFGEWRYTFSELSFLSLAWAYIFQLGVWTDLSELKGNLITSAPLRWLKSHYQKGNTISKAGWPVLVGFSTPYFKTRIYGLGASIIKRNWLDKNLYEEKLANHGIGDNYGVAINLDEEQGIFVFPDIPAYHYKEPSNRLSPTEAYFQRVMALHYFIVKKKHVSSAWLFWSLTGNFLSALFKGNFKFVVANSRLMKMIAFRENPILRSSRTK